MSAVKVGDTVCWVDDIAQQHHSKVVSVDALHECFLVDYPDDDNDQPTTLLTPADIIEHRADRGSSAKPTEECASCGEAGTQPDECPKSQRPCGHHCNHVWTHDACDWCEATFGGDE